jgi:hypothetical protein
MPFPPIDCTRLQAAAGVRTRHMHRLHPLAKYVDAGSMMLLQTELDKGNDLALLLDDR